MSEKGGGRMNQRTQREDKISHGAGKYRRLRSIHSDSVQQGDDILHRRITKDTIRVCLRE